MKHKLTKTGPKYHCPVCNWTWKGKPDSQCPGVPRFEWSTAPKTYKTINQLKKLGLKPNGQCRGVVAGWESFRYLFDSVEAVPIIAEEYTPLKKNMRGLGSFECISCNKDIEFGKWNYRFWECKACMYNSKDSDKDIEKYFFEADLGEHSQMDSNNKDWAIRWARQIFTGNENTLILDVEVVGDAGLFDSYPDGEIIQISVINMLGKILLTTLVAPNRIITDDEALAQGVTNDMLNNAPTWESVYTELQKLVVGKNIVFYNATFQLQMICQSGKRFYLFPLLNAVNIDCAMCCYARYYGEWNGYTESYINQKLPGETHRSLDDCFAILELIKKMASTKQSVEVSG